jgi:hypothetical protein
MVELREGEAPRRYVIGDQARDEKAGYDKEDVDADKSPENPGTLAWNKTTKRTAMARRPSISLR